ncbi:MAG: hypothetical protein RLZZ196_535 [Bacteroidota bacterium]|jgi:hypothetical protein
MQEKKSRQFRDLTNSIIGKLTVLYHIGKDKHGGYIWRCKCECGNIKDIKSGSLTRTTKSCGCLQREAVKNNNKIVFTKHKLKSHKLYSIWSNMKTRCNNDKSNCYQNYGGRGISICNEWNNDFLSFYNWAIVNGWDKDLKLDRTDNNGNYEPTNCRFITNKENCNNKTNNLCVYVNGIRKTAMQISEETGIEYNTVRRKIKKNKIDFILND